jgi:hypothetical protein
MRYTRLRRQIESGTLIGTQGTPFAGTAALEKITERSGKRNRSGCKKVEDKTEAEVEYKVKKEEGSDGYGGDTDTMVTDTDETDEWSSEDEIPLAKLRKAKLGIMKPPMDEGCREKTERENGQFWGFEQQQRPIIQEQAIRPEHCIYDIANGGRSMFAPGLPIQLYAQQPQQPIQTPISPYDEASGVSFAGQFQSGWEQAEDPGLTWNLDPLQGYSSWKPRKSV